MIPLSDPDIHRRRFPWVNVGLVGLNAVVFVFELALGAERAIFFFTFGVIPAELTQGIEFTNIGGPAGPDITTPIPTWATIVTAMFIHGDLLHFGSNMVYLWVFGDNIEDRLGHVPYLLLYLAAGVAATGMQVAIATQSQIPMVGASGAIAGVLGAYLVLYPHSRIRTLVVAYMITHINIPAIWLLGFWIALQFFGGLGSLGPTAQSGGVAYWAHIGGFAFGVAIVFLLRPLLRRRSRPTPPPSWSP